MVQKVRKIQNILSYMLEEGMSSSFDLFIIFVLLETY